MFLSLSCKIDNFTSQSDHSYPAFFKDSRHLLFKMSMGLFLKFRALEVFSWVENFLFWKLRCLPLNCQKLAHWPVRGATRNKLLKGIEMFWIPLRCHIRHWIRKPIWNDVIITFLTHQQCFCSLTWDLSPSVLNHGRLSQEWIRIFPDWKIRMRY